MKSNRRYSKWNKSHNYPIGKDSGKYGSQAASQPHEVEGKVGEDNKTIGAEPKDNIPPVKPTVNPEADESDAKVAGKYAKAKHKQ